MFQTTSDTFGLMKTNRVRRSLPRRRPTGKSAGKKKAKAQASASSVLDTPTHSGSEAEARREEEGLGFDDPGHAVWSSAQRT